MKRVSLMVPGILISPRALPQLTHDNAERGHTSVRALPFGLSRSCLTGQTSSAAAHSGLHAWLRYNRLSDQAAGVFSALEASRKCHGL
jgi:hypothetical protein